MSHYTHHIDDSGKDEPTIIEIKGEPYPEELDPELHEFNRVKGRVADAALEHKAVVHRWVRSVKDYGNRSEQARRGRAEASRASRAFERALAEYEKMRGGEGGER